MKCGNMVPKDISKGFDLSNKLHILECQRCGQIFPDSDTTNSAIELCNKYNQTLKCVTEEKEIVINLNLHPVETETETINQ